MSFPRPARPVIAADLPTALALLSGGSGGLFCARLILEARGIALSGQALPLWAAFLTLLGTQLGAGLYRLLLALGCGRGVTKTGASRISAALVLAPLLGLIVYLREPYPDPVGATRLLLSVAALCSGLGALTLLPVERLSWRMAAFGGASALMIGAFALYLRTLAPSVLWGDSGEFQFVPYVLGIAHPPGYPLYTLLGKLFASLPFGTVAYRLNSMSAVFAALTVPAVYLMGLAMLAAQSDGGRRLGAFLPGSGVWPAVLAALAGAMMLAASPTWWSQATIAAVRSLNGFLLAAALVLLLAWHRDRRDRWLAGFACAFGLGMAHHLSTWTLGPAFLIFVLLTDRRPLLDLRRLARLAVAFLLPLLTFLYLPIRSAMGSPFDASHPTTLENFLNLVLARGFGGDMFHYGWADLPQRLDLYAQLLKLQFGEVGLALAALGFVAVAWRSWRPAALLMLVLATNSIISITYRAPVIADYLIPTYLVLAVYLAGGIWLLSITMGETAAFAVSRASRRLSGSAGGSTIGNWASLSIGLVLLSLPIQAGQANYSTWDMSSERAAEQFSQQALQHAGSGAHILADWNHVTPLWYYQLAEGQRPDLKVDYVYPEGPSLPWAKRAEASLRLGQTYLTNYDLETARRFRLQPVGPLAEVSVEPTFRQPAMQHPLGYRLEDKVELLGYDLSSESVRPGEMLAVTLYWKALIKMDKSYTVFVHAVDGQGKPWGQRDSLPVKGYHATDRWVPGEVVADRYELAISPGAPPGSYRLLAGMYETPTPSTWKRLTVADAQGKALGDAADLGQVTLQGEREPSRPLQYPLARRFVGGLDFLGYDVDENTDGRLAVSLHWRAAAVLEPYQIVVEALNAKGQPLASGRGKLEDARPLPTWPVGEVGRTRYELQWDPGVGRASALRLRILSPTGEAVPLLAGWWRPVQQDVQFSLPAPGSAQPLWVNFGNLVLLRDYQVQGNDLRPGGTLRIRLGWQALRRLGDDMSVFVHLLDEKGQMRAQSDGVPVHGGYPTLRWTQGRAVDDWHELALPADLPPGEYRLEVGIYQVTTGERLSVLDERLAEAFQGDRVLLGPVEISARR